MNARILIADNDTSQRRLLEERIRGFGYEVEVVSEARALMTRLQDPAYPHVHALIFDLNMPDLEGAELLLQLQGLKIFTPVIIQTAHGSIDTAIAMMRGGASDFLIKPVRLEKIRLALENALRTNVVRSTFCREQHQKPFHPSFGDIVTHSKEMRAAITLGEKAARSRVSVLIEGETGVGKELMAHAIQSASDLADKPFVVVNCGALPENLVESILFGHAKGAFTGAIEKHVGKFEEANGGTLFLDEIGELPLEVQVKLLRALQEGEIDPVGAKKSVKVNFRLISATNKDLLERVRLGAFREDLYYRLHVFPLLLPPLRARLQDIPDLALNFALRFALEEGKQIRGIAPEALDLLMQYDWPGNVRQLENAVFRAVVLAEGHELRVDEFPQIAASVYKHYPIVGKHSQKAYAADYISLVDAEGALLSMREIEERVILHAMLKCGDDVLQVAQKLNLTSAKLYRKLKEFGFIDMDKEN